MSAISQSWAIEQRATATEDRRILVSDPKDPAKLLFIVHLVDPGALLDGLSGRPFAKALADPIHMDRLRFLHHQLSRRRHHVKVTIREFDTEVIYLERDSSPNEEAPTDIFFHFEGQFLPQDPNLSFVGVVTQLFFDEQKARFPGSIEALIELAMARYRVRHGPFTVDKSLLREQIYEIFRLRTAWLLSGSFYARMMLRAPRAERLPVVYFRERVGTGIWEDSFVFYERIRVLDSQRDSIELNDFLRERFIQFYDVDSDLVELVWDTPLPAGWEFALTAP